MSIYLESLAIKVKDIEDLYLDNKDLFHQAFLATCLYITLFGFVLFLYVKKALDYNNLVVENENLKLDYIELINKKQIESNSSSKKKKQSSKNKEYKKKHDLLGNLKSEEEYDDDEEEEEEDDEDDISNMSEERLQKLLQIVREMQKNGDLKDENNNDSVTEKEEEVKEDPRYPIFYPKAIYLRSQVINKDNRFEFFEFHEDGRLVFGSHLVETGSWLVNDKGLFVMTLNIGWEPIPLAAFISFDFKMLKCSDGTTLSCVEAVNNVATDDCYLFKSDTPSIAPYPEAIMFDDDGSATCLFEGKEETKQWSIINKEPKEEGDLFGNHLKLLLENTSDDCIFEVYSYLMLLKNKGKVGIYICKGILDLNNI